MIRPRLAYLFLLVNILLTATFLVAYAGASFPMVGHDFRYFIPRLIDTCLHYKINGLSIQWYTPSFGGGLPAYPNPQNIQFSLPQLLTSVMNPWLATMTAGVLYLAVGFVAAHFFFKRVLQFGELASILGAIFFNVNGFIIQHTAIGHLGYQTFPLVPIVLIALAYRRLPALVAGSLVALIFTIMLHSAGFYIIVISLLTILIVLPLVVLIKPDLLTWKHLAFTTLWSVLLTGLLAGSKIWAVASFMRFFPRSSIDIYQVDWITGLGGLIMQMAGSMTTLPILKFSGNDPLWLDRRLRASTGANYGIWELDTSISPVIFLLLLGGLVVLLMRKPQKQTTYPIKKVLAGILLALTIWLTIEFSMARGVIYPLLRDMPVLRSLHVNVRFASAFIAPLAIAGAWIFGKWTQSWQPRKVRLVFGVCNLLTLSALGAYFLSPIDTHVRNFNISESITTYQAIAAGGETFPVETIMTGLNDAQVFAKHASNLKPYEPLFGYELEDFKPTVQPGSVWNESEGYFNMNNPAGFVFPEENKSAPFTRIPVTDRNRMADFVNRLQPDWNIPVPQTVMNWISVGSVGLILVILSIFLTSTILPHCSIIGGMKILLRKFPLRILVISLGLALLIGGVALTRPEAQSLTPTPLPATVPVTPTPTPVMIPGETNGIIGLGVLIVVIILVGTLLGLRLRQARS